jgi:hypothetical protein
MSVPVFVLVESPGKFFAVAVTTAVTLVARSGLTHWSSITSVQETDREVGTGVPGVEVEGSTDAGWSVGFWKFDANDVAGSSQNPMMLMVSSTLRMPSGSCPTPVTCIRLARLRMCRSMSQHVGLSTSGLSWLLAPCCNGMLYSSRLADGTVESDVGSGTVLGPPPSQVEPTSNRHRTNPALITIAGYPTGSPGRPTRPAAS